MSMNLRKLAKKLVQNKRDKKTQKVRLDFIILSLNLSVFFFSLASFAQSLSFVMEFIFSNFHSMQLSLSLYQKTCHQYQSDI